MNTTGNRIRELRLKNRLTLDDVARHLGVGRQAIYKYEQGTVTNIPLENMEKMAELFGTTPGYLAGWTEDHPDDPLQNTQAHTREARFISAGVDKMPPEEREKVLKILQTVFVDYFKEDHSDDA